MSDVNEITCPTCHGSGQNPSNTDPCEACGGPGCYTLEEMAPLTEQAVVAVGAEAVDAPTSVLAVALHLLSEYGPMEASKLHALCYFAQAWHLAWSGRPLFAEPIYAEAEGPMTKELTMLTAGLTLVRPSDIVELVTAPCGEMLPTDQRYYDHVTICSQPACVDEANSWRGANNRSQNDDQD